MATSKKKNKLGVKNSLVNNINARKEKKISRSSKKSSVSKDAYADMEDGWSKDKKWSFFFIQCRIGYHPFRRVCQRFFLLMHLWWGAGHDEVLFSHPLQANLCNPSVYEPWKRLCRKYHVKGYTLWTWSIKSCWAVRLQNQHHQLQWWMEYFSKSLNAEAVAHPGSAFR